MPTPRQVVPPRQPGLQSVKAPTDPLGWEDNWTIPCEADDFNGLAVTHLNALLFKLIDGHQDSLMKMTNQQNSRIHALQTQINYLQALKGESLSARTPPATPPRVFCTSLLDATAPPPAFTSPKEHNAVGSSKIQTTERSLGSPIQQLDSKNRQSGFSLNDHPCQNLIGSPKECDDAVSSQMDSIEISVGNQMKQMDQKKSRSGFSLDSPVQSLSGRLSNILHGSEASRRESWGDILRRVNNPRFSLMQRMKGFDEEMFSDSKPKSRVRSFVSSSTFELISGAVILANVVVMGLQLEYDGFDIGHGIRPGTYTMPAHQLWPDARDTFLILDAIFNVCFSAELLLRVYSFRFQSIRKGWIWFDAITVTLSVVDTLSAGRGLGFDPSLIRLVRLVRLVRLLKVFKAMASFDSLFLLLKAINASVGALLWSFLLLAGVQVGVGLFLCQILQSYIADQSKDPQVRDQAFTYFGTYSRTMITMFEITLANWVPTCRFLVEEVHVMFFLFYLVYRCMFCFSVLKVIAAVFIAETNRVLAGDVELTLMKAHKEKIAYKDKLNHVFRNIDSSGNGVISWSDMQTFLTDAERSAWLATVGFNRTDFEKLFWLIEVNGLVSTEKFLSMVGQLKGQAKTVDLLTMFKVLHKMDKRLSQGIRSLCSGSPLLPEHDFSDSDIDEQEEALLTLGQGGTLVNNDLDKVVGEVHIR